MVTKTKDKYTFKTSWDDVLKNVVAKDNSTKCEIKLDKIDASYSCDATMFGDKAMTPNQRTALTKMNDMGAAIIKKRTRRDIDRVLKDALKDMATKNADKKLIKDPKKLQAEKAKIADDAVAEIEELIDKANDKIHDKVDGNIAGYVKGRHHARKKKMQIVKHTVKVGLAPPLAVAGIAFAATGFAAPVGIVAIQSGMGSVKGMVDYIRVHKQGYAGLAQSIEKNLAAVKTTADAYEAAVKKINDPNSDFATRLQATKDLSKVKSVILKREIVAHGAAKFWHGHEKSIDTLKRKADKYRKKINKHKYLAIKLHKTVEKLQQNVVKTRKEVAKQKAKLTSLNALPTKERNRMVIVRGTLTDQINTMNKNLINLQDAVNKKVLKADKEISTVVVMEDKFETWAERVDQLREMRPKSLQHWKRAINGLAIFKAVAEIGVSGGSDGVGGIASGLPMAASLTGYISASAETVKDSAQELQGLINKPQTT